MTATTKAVTPISQWNALAGWLVGSSLREVERDLVLETLSHTHGNRTVAAHLLRLGVDTAKQDRRILSRRRLCSSS
jgi:DNA-binding NtrC family response regulator